MASGSCADCAKLQSELSDVRTMMETMEVNHADIVRELERKYNDEVASMQTLLDEAAAEASSLTSRKFEQERTKLFENNNEMEAEIKRLRRLVVEGARNQQLLEQQQQQMQQQAQLSPSRTAADPRDSNVSVESVQMYEDEIEMLKIQLATANQEITKLTLEHEKSKQESSAAEAKAAELKENPLSGLSPEEANVLSERLSQAEKMVQQLTGKLTKAENELVTLKGSTAESIEKTKIKLSELREKLLAVTEINRRLTFYYGKKSREMQDEMIDLPTSPDELMMSALAFREQVILERANREVMREKMGQEIDRLKAEYEAEKTERLQMEQLLSSEIDSLRQEIMRDRSVSKTKSLQSISSPDESITIGKSPSGVTDAELEAVKREKTALESELHTLRQQYLRLQVELETSESVQQDLVRLSQSLQVSLESLRDQSEVRWEFDDEVDQCRSCKKTLPVSQQKLHCRHCGKIYCDSCLQQSVPSGASRRPAKVCSQCHFLLVQDAKPYFTGSAD